MRSYLLFLGIAFMYCSTGLAQKLSGKVSSEGKIVPGANVVLTLSGKGAAADDNGFYSLNVSAGTYKVVFSALGFEKQTINVTLAIGENKILDVELAAAINVSQDVVVVGSRSQPRSSIVSSLPIDNVDAATLKSTGQPSFDKALQYRIPSFNTVNTPVNDASTLLDPYEIRNLGPSRTLILINGKRKNLSALLYVQFAPGRGETGADISAIPIDAIKNVEILRDGASAQYGSDAIAGVMNIVLKDKFQYSTFSMNGGVTSKGDGGTYGISLNSGANFAGRGFINYTIAVSQQDNAVRSGIIDVPTEIATFGDPTQSNNSAVNQPIVNYLSRFPTANNINGTGATSAAKFLYNLGIPLGEKGLFYSNAAYVAKKVLTLANYRPPYWKKDYGLLHVPDPNGIDYTGSTSASDIALYKGYLGYQPTFEGDLIDYNATIGVKNEENGWKHDISLTIGGNQQLYTVANTLNQDLKAASPTSFKPGGYNFSNVIGNIDISKNVTDNFSVAFGSEVRTETYTIIAGDTASFSGQGANSFPGIRTENAGTNSRFNLGAYLDASWDIGTKLLVNGTVRGEKYSDFGTALVWKISSRYKLIGENLVLRGSASTGFRAPTLHQIYDQSTQAAFVGGVIQLSGLFNNKSKQAFALGIPPLTPEKSNNYTLGIGAKPIKNLTVTVDYYNIIIKDRIVYSSSISSNNPNSQLGQILSAANVKTIQFFINGIKTRTEGIDFVANYKGIALGKGKLGINLAGNYTMNNDIIGSPNDPAPIKAGGSTILNTQIKSLLTNSRPRYKAVLGFDYNIGKFMINENNTLFGTTQFQDLDNGGSIMEDIIQKFSPKVVSDIDFGYNFSSKLSANITVSNIFNVLPSWKLLALNQTGQAVLNDPTATNLLEGFLTFSGRYRILGYNGSQFSQLGTTFAANVTLHF